MALKPFPLPRVSLENVEKGKNPTVASALALLTCCGRAFAIQLGGVAGNSLPRRGFGTEGAFGRGRTHGSARRRSPGGIITGARCAGGQKGGAGGESGGCTESVGGKEGVRKVAGIAGWDLLEGGTGPGLAGRAGSSHGMWSLSAFWASVAAEAAVGPGESVSAGNGPWEAG